MITVVDYDPAWAVRFEDLRREYGRALETAGVPAVAIVHAGSTAVSGLAAKPVIDFDIVVRERDVASSVQLPRTSRRTGKARTTWCNGF